MHIVAIAWIYVVLMMAITERSVIAGIMTFLLYGVLPLAVILYLMGTRQRKQRRIEAENSARTTEAEKPSTAETNPAIEADSIPTDKPRP